jgi:hypothetical protein
MTRPRGTCPDARAIAEDEAVSASCPDARAIAEDEAVSASCPDARAIAVDEAVSAPCPRGRVGAGGEDKKRTSRSWRDSGNGRNRRNDRKHLGSRKALREQLLDPGDTLASRRGHQGFLVLRIQIGRKKAES